MTDLGERAERLNDLKDKMREMEVLFEEIDTAFGDLTDEEMKRTAHSGPPSQRSMSNR